MKKQFRLLPAMIAGLILSFNPAWGEECTIATVAGNGSNSMRLHLPDMSWRAEVATDTALSELRAINIDHLGNAVFTIRIVYNNLVRITPFGGLEGVMPPSGSAAISCENFSFSTNGDLYCLSNPYSADYVGSIIRYPADGGPEEQFDREEMGAFSFGGLAVDSSQNLYFTSGVHTAEIIRGYAPRAAAQIKKRSPDGAISIIADGWENGFNENGGREAVCELRNPSLPVTVDELGNLYFKACDFANWDTDGYGGPNPPAIKKISVSGRITALAEGFDYSNIEGMAAGDDGSVFFASSSDHTIKKISSDGTITTIAGDGTRGFSGDGGPASAAQLNDPRDVAVDSNGNIYVADNGNHRIRKITCLPEADLSVSLGAMVLRGRLDFTSIVNNNGPEEATNVVLVNNLPSGLWMVESYPVGMCSGTTTVTCNLSNMEVGQERRIAISTVAPLRGPRRKVLDRVSVSSDTSDPNMVNNSARVVRILP